MANSNPYPQLELNPTSNAVTLLDPLGHVLTIIKKERVAVATADGTHVQVSTEDGLITLYLFVPETAKAVWVDICRQHPEAVLWVREPDGWVRR